MTEKLRRIWNIARIQYKKFWNINSVLIILFSVIFIGECTVSGMRNASAQTGLMMNYLEPSILVFSESYFAMIIPISVLVLLSGFPDRSTSGVFILSRSSRRSWFTGEILYSIMVTVSYMVIMILGTFLWVGKQGEWSVSWSRYTTRIYAEFPEIYEANKMYVIGSGTMAHGNVWEVLIIEMLLMVLYILVMVQLLSLFSLYQYGRIGQIVGILLTVFGAVIIEFLPEYKWFSPLTHAIFGLHFNMFYAKPICSIETSLLFFTVLNIVLLALNQRAVKTCYIGDKNN